MGNNKSTILIVDDVPTNLQVLGRILQIQDYIIMAALNGQTALEMAAERKPDLILLDIMMPDMNGFDVCIKLKSSPETQAIPVIFLTSKNEPEDIVKGFKLGAVDYVSKPFNSAELLSRIKTHTELNKLQKRLEIAVEDRTKKLYDTLEELKDTHNKLHGAYVELIKRLARASDYRDNETGMHISRMASYSQLLGKAYGLKDEHCQELLHASSMHDVGKIGIPDGILLKPGKLDKDEFEIMKTHTIIGGKLLADIDSDLCRMAEQIALTHHEKWNGKGYPNGLSKEDIPIEGRITAVADVFDALTSVRPYKEAWTVEKSVNLLIEEKGEHFDPKIVDLFVENLPQILAIKEKYSEDDNVNS
ncbi:chemotaxis protein CheY [Candidatus Magnetomorum sp. HK-1]|nr:chemotaxis protein CheY [Candidatus Magnetomorum sp. HK-1]